MPSDSLLTFSLLKSFLTSWTFVYFLAFIQPTTVLVFEVEKKGDERDGTWLAAPAHPLRVTAP